MTTAPLSGGASVSRDPLAIVRDALEAHDCQPRGPLHKTEARCPAHDDRLASLSVGEGEDGRVLLWCHAGCSTEAVVAALNLAWSDLFPVGHRHGRADRLLAPPRSALTIILQALREVGIEYRATRSPDLWVAHKCPACDGSLADIRGYPLWIHEEEGRRTSARVTLACFNGCEQTDILEVLMA